MDFTPEPSGTSLDQEKEVDTSNTQLCTYFNKTVHRRKWLVSYLKFSDELYIIQFDFTSGEERSGRNRSYRSEVGLSSAAWTLESKCGTQYIQVGEMVPGKSDDQNSYQ